MKRRGRTTITFELLKDLLRLDENENIINLYRSPEDVEKDCFTIIIASETESNHTMQVSEGSRLMPMELKNDKTK